MEKAKKTKRKPLKVLVTGGAGFLGHHIIARLEQEGCEITAVVRPSTDLSLIRGKKVKLVFGDIRDKAVLEQAMAGVEVVVHAAATMYGSWDDFYAINVESTKTLLELGRQNGIKRFVHISSVSVYDHTKADEGQIFTEEMPFQTEQLNFYAQSKIEAEKIVWEYVEKQKMPCVVLRPGALYGTGGPLYPAQLGLPLGGNRYGLIGNGRSPLPLCHVQSVVDAVWLAIKRRQAVGACYNLMEDESINRIDFLKKVKETVNPKLSIVKLPCPVLRFMSFCLRGLFGLLGRKAPLRPLYLRTASHALFYSTEHIKKELGWKPGVDFDASIEELLQWHRQMRTPKRNLPIVKGKVVLPTREKVNVGIVGCGAISDVHLSILQRLANANVVALCDPSAAAREQTAQKYRVQKTYASLNEMLQQEPVDVVHVLSPAQFHAPLAVAAMQKNCHVLVEKPMALTAREAEKMVKTAQQKKVKLVVGHNHLFDAVVVKTREIIASGVLGRIAYVESWYGAGLSSDGGNRALAYDARNSWFYKMPGALYQDYISHPISLLTDIMGEVHTAKAVAKYFRVVPFMQTDELRVLVESDEIIGSLCVSLAVSPRYQFLRLYGTRGTLNVDLLNKYVYLDTVPGMLPKTIGRNLSNLKQGKTLLGAGIKNLTRFVFGGLNLFEGTERLIRLFYRSILLDEPVPVTAEEGLLSMQLMDEIWGQLKQQNGRSGLPRATEVVEAKEEVG